MTNSMDWLERMNDRANEARPRQNAGTAHESDTDPRPPAAPRYATSEAVEAARTAREARGHDAMTTETDTATTATEDHRDTEPTATAAPEAPEDTATETGSALRADPVVLYARGLKARMTALGIDPRPTMKRWEAVLAGFGGEWDVLPTAPEGEIEIAVEDWPWDGAEA